MSLQQLRDQIKAEYSRGYNLKTRKAKETSWAKRRVLEDQACDILYNSAKKHGPQSLKATVRCFRPGDDHFLVDTAYGPMWLSPTSDVVSKSWYSHTCCVNYVVGQTIVLEFTTEVNTDKYFLEIIPGEITGGTVDEKLFAELDKRDDLAFFKHSAGGMTGLFSSKKAV